MLRNPSDLEVDIEEGKYIYGVFTDKFKRLPFSINKTMGIPEDHKLVYPTMILGECDGTLPWSPFGLPLYGENLTNLLIVLDKGLENTPHIAEMQKYDDKLLELKNEMLSDNNVSEWIKTSLNRKWDTLCYSYPMINEHGNFIIEFIMDGVKLHYIGGKSILATYVNVHSLGEFTLKTIPDGWEGSKIVAHFIIFNTLLFYRSLKQFELGWVEFDNEPRK